MTFSKSEWSRYKNLSSWNYGDDLFMFDIMPGGAFGLYIVTATNSKNKSDGGKETHVGSKVKTVLFETPKMFRHEVGKEMPYAWPTSFYESMDTLIKMAIYRIFDVETKQL